MRPGENNRREQGFTYLAVLLAIAIIGAGLLKTGERWSRSNQREKEQQLLWVGNQFRNAIGLYYQRTPGAVKRYPQSLEELLEDKRYLPAQRYLRTIYRDPMTGKAEWGTVMSPEGGIAGVHSLSNALPLKQENFPDRFARLAGSKRYSDWKFLYEAPTPVLAVTQQGEPEQRASR